MEHGAYNPYKTAQLQFDNAAEMINLEPAARELMRQPSMEFQRLSNST